MKLFRRKEKRSTEEATTAPEVTTSEIYDGWFTRWLESRDKPMLLSTVYRCVDLISDSLAVLPLETYKLDIEGFKSPLLQTPIYHILNTEPSENMSRYVLFKTLAASTLLTGNGYAYIERNSDNYIDQIHYLPSQNVTIEWVKVNGIERKRYRVAGFKSLVEPRDILHFMDFSYDGHTGVSRVSHASQTLGIASDSEAHASGFFKSGANMAGVLTIEGARLSKGQKEQNYKEWEARTNPQTGKPNGVVILEGNQRYQPISVSPKDSQLLESRQHNVIDICRFFSVSPVKAFDLSKSSYSTVEATQLQYLADTMLPFLTKFELELNRKIFLPSQRPYMKCEFNTSVLLRTDKQSQAAYWNTMFQIGAASPNEIRKEMNLGKVAGGDKTFVQVNVQTLEKAVKENKDGTE